MRQIARFDSSMTLFDDGSEPEELLAHGGSAVLYRSVVDPGVADRLCRELGEQILWDQPTIRMYGKTMLQPRLVAWFGDAGMNYSYSGTTMHPQPWLPTLVGLKAECERLAGVRFNSALANLYRDGQDSVAWHADDEPELGVDPVIASLSLGDVRRFRLRHTDTRDVVSIDLPTGSVVVMSGRCQAEWMHEVPKTKRQVGARINLTFRRIMSARHLELDQTDS